MKESTDEESAIVDQVQSLIKAIPRGRVMSYGAIGSRCEPPISGYICGRILHSIGGENTPWWRVVGKNGKLPISKRNPSLAEDQRRRLAAEGVEFDAENTIVMERYRMD